MEEGVQGARLEVRNPAGGRDRAPPAHRMSERRLLLYSPLVVTRRGRRQALYGLTRNLTVMAPRDTGTVVQVAAAWAEKGVGDARG